MPEDWLVFVVVIGLVFVMMLPCFSLNCLSKAARIVCYPEEEPQIPVGKKTKRLLEWTLGIVILTTLVGLVISCASIGGLVDLTRQGSWDHRQFTVYTDAFITELNCIAANCTCDYVKSVPCSKITAGDWCDGGERCCEYHSGSDDCTKYTTNALCVRQCQFSKRPSMILAYDNTCTPFTRVLHPEKPSVYENGQTFHAYQNPRDISEIAIRFDEPRMAWFIAGFTMTFALVMFISWRNCCWG